MPDLQVGKSKAELAAEWSACFDMAELPDGAWWHTESAEDLKAVHQQSDGASPSDYYPSAAAFGCTNIPGISFQACQRLSPGSRDSEVQE